MIQQLALTGSSLFKPRLMSQLLARALRSLVIRVLWRPN